MVAGFLSPVGYDRLQRQKIRLKNCLAPSINNDDQIFIRDGNNFYKTSLRINEMLIKKI